MGDWQNGVGGSLYWPANKGRRWGRRTRYVTALIEWWWMDGRFKGVLLSGKLIEVWIENWGGEGIRVRWREKEGGLKYICASSGSIHWETARGTSGFAFGPSLTVSLRAMISRIFLKAWTIIMIIIAMSATNRRPPIKFLIDKNKDDVSSLVVLMFSG